MGKPIFFQKIPNTQVNTREVQSTTDAQKASINTILNNFITYFKAKHS